MIRIETGLQVATLMNGYVTTPDQQDHLVALLVKSTEEVVRHQPGYLSAAVYKSLDGAHVTYYSLWTTAEELQAMLRVPAVQDSFREVKARASAYEAYTYTVVYADENVSVGTL